MQRAVRAGYQDSQAQGSYLYVGSRDIVRVNRIDTIDIGTYSSSLLGSC